MIHGLVVQENLPETPTKVQVREQKKILHDIENLEQNIYFSLTLY